MAENTQTKKKSTSTAAKKPQDRKTPAKTSGSTESSINITGSRSAIDLTLVGVDYSVKPPKTVQMLKFYRSIKQDEDDPIVMLDTLVEWIHNTFAEADANHIEARLDDGEDELDLPHLMQLMEQMVEISTDNPTT